MGYKHRYKRNHSARLREWSDGALKALMEAHGNSAHRVAIKIKRSQRYVATVLHERGIEWVPDTKRKALLNMDSDLMARVYLECFQNAHMAAKKLGVSELVFRQEMKRRGVKCKTGKRSFLWTRELLHRWYIIHGMSAAEIGRRLGVGQSCVTRRMKRLGIKARPNFTGKVGVPLVWTEPEDGHLTPAQLSAKAAREIVGRIAARRMGEARVPPPPPVRGATSRAP